MKKKDKSTGNSEVEELKKRIAEMSRDAEDAKTRFKALSDEMTKKEKSLEAKLLELQKELEYQKSQKEKLGQEITTPYSVILFKLIYCMMIQ